MDPSSLIQKLWENCWGRNESASNIFTMRAVIRDKQLPSSEDVHVPQSCWVLSVADWIGELVPEECASGFMIREEYIEATLAAIEYYKKGTYRFVTPPDELTDITARNALTNPFSTLSLENVSKRGGFVLLGHPGIGEQQSQLLSRRFLTLLQEKLHGCMLSLFGGSRLVYRRFISLVRIGCTFSVQMAPSGSIAVRSKGIRRSTNFAMAFPNRRGV
jgi:hypothetical protein